MIRNQRFIIVIILVSSFLATGFDYERYEDDCLRQGWEKITIMVEGKARQLLFKAPAGSWRNGAIILMHGGGGTYSNFCSGLKIGEPMVEFAILALKEGFAIFSPDSGMDLCTDAEGDGCGKRFDSLAIDSRPNADLPFIEKIITEVIPSKRPWGSNEKVFMAGISNGGYMTILAATHFDSYITAFAPISAGDPYGTHMKCGPDLTIRKNAPGFFIDNETNNKIGTYNACRAQSYRHEMMWGTQNPTKKPHFKQFHHEGDSGVHISCMRKAQLLLVQHGYHDDGPFIIKNDGRRQLWKHFWLRRYNRPLIEFFKKHAQKK